ncbi:LIM-domain binding protein-domain-containing protein [Triangularia verruculosa]|uniref:LIM-domain binding protein-domain-containing protein n=1 Tax=Triangularia verruculosa TaxID=2587418 RepID=A0AAN6XSR3_9PEZI|nr:LIM-domain binding protein-domain-containing protein [Triangularia verruculosa]
MLTNPQQHVNIAQQIALQQQQQQQLNQMQNNPNHGQMNPQQINIQQAQMAAMQAQAQQQHQQAQQQAQQAQQQAQQAAQQAAQQGQQPPQPQQQPPQHQQPPQQSGQPQRQATPSQAGGPGPNGQAPTPGPTQGPTPQPNPQQQPQAPPQTPQTTQGQQIQLVAQAQQHATQAQAHAQAQVQAQAQAQQAVHQAQQAAGLAMMQQQQQQQQQQQKRNGMELKGQCLLKLMQFSEHLSGFPGPKGQDDLSYWEDFVKMFFSQKGLFRHTLLEQNPEGPAEKQYEIQYPALPRYFHTHFDSGVKRMQLTMEKGTTDRALPNDCHFIENTKASLVYWFENNSHLVANGTLRAQFDNEQKFELLEFITTGHEEYLPRNMVIQAARPAHNWVKEWHSLNSVDNKQSPEMNKKGKTKPVKAPAGPPPDLELPHSYVSHLRGVTEPVWQFLEMSEIMGQMTPLFDFFHAHPGIAPYAAMEQFVNRINSGGQQGMNGQPMAQGAPRTPSFPQFPMGASPAMANIGLPGSPHVVGSPAPGQLAAPVMQHQMSQPGTSSSGPSANTSPAQGNKRRRSTVKEEDTPQSAPTPGAMGTPQMNGVGIPGKGKPPTPRMPKRMKGNPA